MPRPSISGRFFKKVKMTESCWLWTGPALSHGYGAFGLGPRNLGPVRPYRWCYEFLVGPVPTGLELDHLCRNRLCVNPSHLEPVTHTENVMRGMSPPAVNARKTHCKRGHEFTKDNTVIMNGGRGRQCRYCNSIHSRKQNYNKKMEKQKNV